MIKCDSHEAIFQRHSLNESFARYVDQMQRSWVEIAASCDCKRSPIGAQSHPKGAIVHGDVGTSRAQELASRNEDTAIGVFSYGVVTDDARRDGEQWQREDRDPVSPVLHRDLDVINLRIQ